MEEHGGQPPTGFFAGILDQVRNAAAAIRGALRSFGFRRP
jgi:hypothetical protein